MGPALLALDRPQPGGGPVAADPAPEQRPHAPAGRAARDPRARAAPPPRALAARGRADELGRVLPRRPRARRHRRARRQARTRQQLHARRQLQPRLRPGRGRPVGREPQRLRDLLRGEAAVLPGRPQDPELRARGRGPAVLLAPHRPGPLASAAARRQRVGAGAGEHDDPGRAQGHGQDRGRAVRRRAAELHAAGDGAGLLPARRARAGRRARSELHGGAAPQGLGQGQHQPGRDAHDHAALHATIRCSPRCRRRR